MTPETFLALTARNDQPAFLLTGDGRVLAANARGTDLLGGVGCPATGMDFADYVDPGGPNAFEDLLAAWTAAGVPLARPIPIRRPDGRRVHCRAEGLGVTDPGNGAHSMVLLHLVPLDPVPPMGRIPDPSPSPAADVVSSTDTQPHERTPADASSNRGPASSVPTNAEGRPVGKMEAMGNLAAGIAHDFNNLLTVMKVEVELVLEDENVPAQAVDSLLSCHAAIQRAESLVGGLLAFARRQLVHTAETDLAALLDYALPRLKPILADVRLDVERTDARLPLRIDVQQMEIVLQALVRNAVEASEPGDLVVVRTRRETLGPDFVRENEGSLEGEYAVLEVEDRGTGIEPDVEARMFEPFYTTKGRGYGRGLGLAQAFGIVKMLGGYLKVDSEVGRGSTFTVFLPLSEREA